MDTVRLTVEKLVFEGFGLARHEGWVHFVDGALPGETVEAQVMARRRNFVETRAVRILEASPQRRAPACPAFGHCGGCHLLHLAYPAQLEVKLGFVREALHLVPDLESRLSPVAPSPREYYFRNKLDLEFGRDAQGRRVAGFHVRGHPQQVVSAESCVLMSADATNVIRGAAGLSGPPPAPHARLLIREGQRTGERLVRLSGFRRSAVPEIQTALGPLSTTLLVEEARTRRTIVLTGEGRITERLDRFEFEIGPDTFFQTHPAQAERMFRAVVDIARRTAPGKALDLYAGVGVIAAYLSDAVRDVVAVEADPASAEAARRNLAHNGLADAVRVVTGDAGKCLPGLASRADLIVVDPPRAGLAADMRAALLTAPPCDLLYLSCHPATLGRDLRALLAGGYCVESVQPFDMFPQSFHVETLTHLRWTGSRSAK